MSDRAYIPKAKTVDWATPQHLFDGLDARWAFTLDVAAAEHNAKCARYFTQETDGLKQPWRELDGSPARVWCNPPYGREIKDWMQKARDESAQGTTVVLLVPARTDTKWFHEIVLACPWAKVEFIKGRLKFGGCKDPAPFPTMLVTFNKEDCRDEA